MTKNGAIRPCLTPSEPPAPTLTLPRFAEEGTRLPHGSLFREAGEG